MTDDGRRYTEEEFARILRRASELQARRLPLQEDGPGGELPGPPAGMSLSEMESIATEVGIDATLVRQAAAEMAVQTAEVEGRPDERFVLKHAVPGRISRDDLVRVLRSIQDSAGVHGDTEPSVSGVEWKGGDVVRTVVTADSTEDQTELRVAVDATGAKILSHFFPGLAGLLTSVAVGATLEPGVAAGAAILAGGIGTGLGVGNLIWRRVLARTRDNASRIFRAGMAALEAGAGAGGGDESGGDEPDSTG